MTISNQPVYQPPTSAPDEWTVDKLKEHLQTAVILELHTIPPYLFAAYTIKDNPLSTYKILTVVRQEMLHLALSGNLLCAIGGQPKVYGFKYTPHYPAKIFYDQTRIDLKPGTRKNIETFARIEAPRDGGRGPDEWLLPTYQSIGQFYDQTLKGLEELSEGNDLFKPDSIARQFQTADGSWYDRDMTAICNKESAKRALNLVIEQGEGNSGEGKTQDGERLWNTFQTHHEIFVELSEKHQLRCYDVIENPRTEELKNEKVYPVMKACDAAYSYLLLTMEKAWEYSGPRRKELVTNNIMSLMLTVLKPFALFLVKQPLQGRPEKNAAPGFNLYEFDSPATATAYATLKALTKEALEAYPGDRELEPVGRAVNELLDIGSI